MGAENAKKEGIEVWRELKSRKIHHAVFYGEEGAPENQPRAVLYPWGLYVPQGWAVLVEHGCQATLIRIVPESEARRDTTDAAEEAACAEAKQREDAAQGGI